MRKVLEEKLKQLETEVLALGRVVEEAIVDSVVALQQHDCEESKRIVEHDQKVNATRYALEEECLKVIATQQPNAIDLRTIAAILDITTELERIYDYHKGIGKINLTRETSSLLEMPPEITRMSHKAQDMLHRSLLAFASRNADMAYTIPKEDDEVDTLYHQVYRKLVDRITADPIRIDEVNYLLWTAHNLERTADRVTNICERVVFTVTGELVELDSDTGLTGMMG